MTLNIDGRLIEPKPGQSLLDLIRQAGMDTDKLSTRPLAAKIAGEVFSLNYVPVRQKDADADRPSIRRAMAASNGQVRLLRYGDDTGREVYTRTAQFVTFLALHRLYPQARAKMNCTVGSGLFIAVYGCKEFSVRALKAEIAKLVEMDIPLIRQRLTTEEAVARCEFFQDISAFIDIYEKIWMEIRA